MARIIARVILALLIVVQLGFGYLLTIDPKVGDQVFDPTPQVIVTYRNPELPHRAVVFFTGTQSSGLTHSEDIQKEFWSLGSFVVVEYNRQAFDGIVVLTRTFTALQDQGFTELYLVGSSIGGLLSLDFLAFNLTKSPTFKKLKVLGVVLSNVPRGLVDLYDQRAKYLANRHVGPRSNKLLEPVMRAMFNPPPPGPGANLELLKRHHQASRTWPVSGWLDEISYAVTHRTFLPRQFSGVKVVVIVATKDNVVKPTFVSYMLNLFGASNDRVIQVDSGHEQYVDDPQPWHRAMSQAVGML